MKSYLIGLMTALMLVVAGNTEAAPKRIKGSGQIVSKQIEVGAFDGIAASRAIDVKLVDLTQGQEGQVKVYADDNLIDWVRAKVSNGVLHLTIDDELHILSNAHVNIIVPTSGKLTKLKATSAADIKSEVRIVHKLVKIEASSSGEIKADIVAEECTIDVSSAGEYEGEVKSNSCSVDASSSGDAELTLTTQKCHLSASSAASIEVQGAALECEIEANSAASINGEKFVVKKADVEASSAADATISCLEEFKGHASSAGDIVVYGKPKSVSSSASSGGSIQNK
ncbi:MAG: DUF2807 domain-containing protein [Alistipes sp.]|nr:DUF2807 domain-containing protein [Alistipes sp.]